MKNMSPAFTIGLKSLAIACIFPSFLLAQSGPKTDKETIEELSRKLPNGAWMEVRQVPPESIRMAIDPDNVISGFKNDSIEKQDNFLKDSIEAKIPRETLLQVFPALGVSVERARAAGLRVYEDDKAKYEEILSNPAKSRAAIRNALESATFVKEKTTVQSEGGGIQTTKSPAAKGGAATNGAPTKGEAKELLGK